MKDPIATYLRKHATAGPWRVDCRATANSKAVVVIPALAEEERLFITLDDLAANEPALLAQTIVLIVVNNRVPAHADPEDIANNLRTLARLRSLQQQDQPLRLAMLDAASPGLELPPKAGVGHARRIGLDAALAILAAENGGEGILACLDADTRVESNYLAALFEHFAKPNAWACVLHYAHDLSTAGEQLEAIIDYELYLRHYTLGLHLAGSSYGYHAIGSTIACTARAYAAAGGMPRREAGEDFYYLQQLAKTGSVGFIGATTVRPAARLSRRVPFGTGRSLIQYHENRDLLLRRFNASQSYCILGDVLRAASVASPDDVQSFLRLVLDASPCAATFLREQGIDQVWPAWARQAASAAAFRAQFHRWFDAFKTLKLLRALQQEVPPPGSVNAAVRALMAEGGVLQAECNNVGEANLAERIELLRSLRKGDHIRYAGMRWSPAAPGFSMIY
jgi:hypothetical protein